MIRRVAAGIAVVGAVVAAVGATPRSPRATAASGVDPTHYVLLTHGAIDPLAGGPEPAPRTYRTAPASGTLWLVQLHAPLTAARQAAFAGLQPRILGYLPFATFVVRADPATATTYRARADVVRAVIPLQPWEKVRDEVMRAPLGTPLRLLTWRDSPASEVARRLAGLGIPVTTVGSSSVLLSRAGPWLPQIAADDGVAFVGLMGTMRPSNTDARWVTETSQRDDFHLSDPVGGRNGLGLPGEGLDGSGEAVGAADTGMDYAPDQRGQANFYFSDCSTPLAPSATTCKLADLTYEATTASNPFTGTYHVNHTLGLPGSGVHRKVEAYFDLVGDGDPNSVGPSGSWHGDSGASTHGSHVSGSIAGNRCDPCQPLPRYPGRPYLGTGAASYDGIAPQARLVFQDVGTDGESLAGLPGDIYQLWDQAYDLGRDPTSDAGDVNDVDGASSDADHAASVFVRGITPRIHSNSYGSIIPAVSLGNSPRTDDFDVGHEDFLQVVAAGNSGPDVATVGEPATAKDVLTVGASANGRLDFASLDTMANFSSHGVPSILSKLPGNPAFTDPFDLSAIKPDVAAPGLHNVSPKGGTDTEAQVLQGTSMATPTAAGDAVLVRQYLEDGFGPQTPGHGYAVGVRDVTGRGVAPGAAVDGVGGRNPSAALVKAILIASGQRMRGAYTGNDGSNPAQNGQWPSGGQGWGRIDLASALHFGDVPDSPDLWLQDVPYGLGNPTKPGGVATGDDVTYRITVASSSRPLKVILDWTDPGGLASFIGAGPEAIVNQLQLQVDAPDGTQYCGNRISTMIPSHAADDVPTSLPGACPALDLDLANNVQGVYLPAPAPGTYTVHVIGNQVVQPQNTVGVTLPPCTPLIPTCRQGYAVVATGSFSDPSIVHGGTPPALHPPTVTGVAVTASSGDAAVVHWQTSSPSTSAVTATGSRGDTQTVTDVYSRSSFPGLHLVVVENQGPTFLDRPVYGDRHEAKLTGLHPGETYALTFSAGNAAGTTTTGVMTTFTTPSDVFSIADAADTANLIDETTGTVNVPGITDPTAPSPWGASAQFYVGQLPTTLGALGSGLLGKPVPGQEAAAIGAFRFTLPPGVDLGSVTGAVVLLETRQDITSRVQEVPHHHLDLLAQSADASWGPGTTYSTVANGPVAAHLDPVSSAIRDVPYVTEAFTVGCADLDTLLGNLKANSQAAFRISSTGDSLDESLYAWESGFGRRASGLEMRPRLLLFRGPQDPLGQVATTAPVISGVRVERLDADDATVSWTTNVPSSSLVLFRSAGSGATPAQVGSPAYVTAHQVGLTHLGGASIEFAVRSATPQGQTTTDSGGPQNAYLLPAGAPPASPPGPAPAGTGPASGSFAGATESSPSATNIRFGDGLVCASHVSGVTPGQPTALPAAPNTAPAQAAGAVVGVVAVVCFGVTRRLRRRGRPTAA